MRRRLRVVVECQSTLDTPCEGDMRVIPKNGEIVMMCEKHAEEYMKSGRL